MAALEDVRVRPLQGRDEERWRALWAAYTAFYREEITAVVTDRTFQRLCDAEQAMTGLVAVNGDDQPVGLAHLVFHPSTWSAGDSCYLEDLYVNPSHRGGRVARLLFDAVYALAVARGVERVYWHTQQFNGAARSLYDRVGTLTSFVVYEHVAH